MKYAMIVSMAILASGCSGGSGGGSAAESLIPDCMKTQTALFEGAETSQQPPCQKSEQPSASETQTDGSPKTEASESKSSAAKASPSSSSALKYALVSLAESSYSFSEGVLNSELEYALSVSNKGDVAATSLALSALEAPYRLISKTCSDTLDAGKECSYKIGYKPTAIGSSSASPTVSYNDGQESKTKTLSLSGSACPKAASISPSSSVASQTLTVSGQNFTSQTLVKIGGVECQKTNVQSGSVSCSIPSGSGTQVVSVSENGKENLYSSFTYMSNASISPAAASYNFGNVRKNNTSTTTIALTNNGGFTASNISVSVSSPFSASLSSCSSLAAGSSCSLSISYAPTTVGSHSSTATISYNNGTSNVSATVSVSGTAIAKAIAVAANNGGSCVLYSEGTIRCVGQNSRIGNGLTTGSTQTWADSTLVSGINNAVQISGYGPAMCATLSDGTVKCWGQYTYPANGAVYATPVTISGIANAASVQVGNTMIAIKTADGYVKTWGNNLGNGSTTSNSNIVNVSNVPSSIQISSLAAGSNHVTAITSSGTVVSWGKNLLNPNYGNYSNTVPTAISGLSNITQVASGQDYSCALNSSGNMYCWGSQTSGTLADGVVQNVTVDFPSAPVLTSLTNVSQIKSGAYHSCAIKTNKTVYCWGINTYGVLGNISNGNNPQGTPLQAGSISNAAQLAIGYVHTMALTETGDLYVWGENSSYQLGLGDTSERNSPVLVTLP